MDPLLTNTALPAVTKQQPHYSIRSKSTKVGPDSLIVEHERDHAIQEAFDEEDVAKVEKAEVKKAEEKNRYTNLQPTSVLTSKTNSATKRIERKTMN